MPPNLVRFADLGVGADGVGQDAFVPRLERQNPLAGPDDDATQRDLAGFLHGGADDAEGLLRQLAVGREEVRVVPVEPVDFVARHEPFDLDGLGALQLVRRDLVVGQQDVFALGDLITLHQLRPLDRPRVRVRRDHLDAVVGLGIDQVEVDVAA